MKRTSLLLAATALAAGGVAAPAHGQSLDYDALEALFGEPVTAGATGAPQRASDAPATMIIITAEDIARFPEFDLPGILRHYAGVDAQRYAAGQGEVAIRGYRQPYQPRLLVLVDGRQVYLDTYAYTSWSLLPVQRDEIRQIEVIKGPQSALYGFNAMSGVINIITRNPGHGGFGAVRAEAGSDGYGRASASVGGAITERLSARFSLGSVTQDEFDTGPRGGDGSGLPGPEAPTRFTSAEATTAAGALRLQLSPQAVAVFEATWAEAEQAEMQPYYQLVYADMRAGSVKAEVSADTRFGLVTARAYQNYAELAYEDFDPRPNVLTDNTVTVAQLETLFKPGPADTVRLAAEFRNNRFPSRPTRGQGSASYDVWSASAMWSRSLGDSLDLTVAGRFDALQMDRNADPDPSLFPFSAADYERSIEEVSYNAALAWRPGPNDVVRLSAARGVQTPSFVEFGFTYFVESTGLVISGDPNLEPTLVDAAELAWDRRIGDRANLRASLFATRTQDLKGFFSATDLSNFALPPAAPRPAALFVNQGDSELVGLELSLASRPGAGVRWGVDYTWLSVEDDLTINQDRLDYAVDYEASTPEHQINARLGTDAGRWSFDGFLIATSGFDEPRQPVVGFVFLEEIDASVSVSARAAYRLTDRVEVSLSARDLTYGDGRRVHSGPEVPALWWASVKARF